MPFYASISEIWIGPLHIHIWGVFAALGFLLALRLSLRRAFRFGISKYLIWDSLILALIGMIGGSRIFYLFSNPGDGWGALAAEGSGFSLAGGMLAAAILCLVYLKHKGQEVLRVFDLFIPGAIIALISVRTGCFLIDDHVGKMTTFPGGIPYQDGAARHPVALYEIIFLSLMSLIIRRLEKESRPEGALFLIFSLSYATFRVLVDFLRCDDLAVCEARSGGLTASQWFFLGNIVFLVGLSLKKEAYHTRIDRTILKR